MPRPPVGNTTQERSLTALYAYVVGALEGVGARERDTLCRGLEILVKKNGLERAAKDYLWDPPRASDPPPRTHSGTLRPWLLVDEPRMGIERALVRFPGAGRRRPDLLELLRQTPGVRQLVELRTGPKDIVAVMLFQDTRDRERLEAVIEAEEVPYEWDEIRSEDHEPALGTWRFLVRRAAEKEKLLAE